jgi:hypothetical protein
LSTLPYGDALLALHLEGKKANLSRKLFVKFGERFDLPAAAVESAIDRIIERAEPWLSRLAEIGFTEQKTAHLRRQLVARRDLLRNKTK